MFACEDFDDVHVNHTDSDHTEDSAKSQFSKHLQSLSQNLQPQLRPRNQPRKQVTQRRNKMLLNETIRESTSADDRHIQCPVFRAARVGRWRKLYSRAILWKCVETWTRGAHTWLQTFIWRFSPTWSSCCSPTEPNEMIFLTFAAVKGADFTRFGRSTTLVRHQQQNQI